MDTATAGLTGAQIAWLEYVDKGARDGFDCMFSCRRHRRAVAEGLVEKGMLAHLRAVRCDEVGSPTGGVEKYATGYELDDAGHAYMVRAAQGGG